jgi:hypothetical protein
MLRPLPIRAQPHNRETLFSLVCRTAALNRLSPADFCDNLGVSIRGVALLEPVAVDKVVNLCGLDDQQIANIISWTGKQAGGVRSVYRGETIVTRAIRSPDVRGCPICLKGDSDGQKGAPTGSMIMRGHWLLKHTLLCIDHGHPIVRLWSAPKITTRYINDDLLIISGDILAGKINQPAISPSAYDQWLDDRLESKIDRSWLSDLSIHSVATAALQIGRCLLKTDDSASSISLAHHHEAAGRGFEALAVGRDHFQRQLEELAQAAMAEGKGPGQAFNPLYSYLANNSIEDADFNWVTDPLRKIVSEGWPVASRKRVLGRDVGRQELHSVATAATALGLRQDRTRVLLQAEGIIEEGDPRSDAQITFPASKIIGLREKISPLIDLKDLRRQFGATEFQFEVLVREGFFKPTVLRKRARKAWDPAPVMAFLDWYLDRSVGVAEGDTDWESLHSAAVSRRMSVSSLIDGIKQGDMTPGKWKDSSGYAALCVQTDQVDAKLARRSKSST